MYFETKRAFSGAKKMRDLLRSIFLRSISSIWDISLHSIDIARWSPRICSPIIAEIETTEDSRKRLRISLSLSLSLTRTAHDLSYVKKLLSMRRTKAKPTTMSHVNLSWSHFHASLKLFSFAIPLRVLRDFHRNVVNKRDYVLITRNDFFLLSQSFSSLSSQLVHFH